MLTNLGNSSIDKNLSLAFAKIRPPFRHSIYILSPRIKTLSNVVLVQFINGVCRAVKSADILIRAHCFPLDCGLKISLP